MSERDELRRNARQWKRKAEDDFAAATTLLKADRPPLRSAICFHVQQAVEKYIKACLVLRRIDFPRTHNIAELVNLLPDDCRPQLPVEEQERLSAYAVVTRYPGEADLISPDAVEEAVHIARRVRLYFRKRMVEEGE